MVVTCPVCRGRKTRPGMGYMPDRDCDECDGIGSIDFDRAIDGIDADDVAEQLDGERVIVKDKSRATKKTRKS